MQAAKSKSSNLFVKILEPLNQVLIVHILLRINDC
jgi:hypothetical protein